MQVARHFAIAADAHLSKLVISGGFVQNPYPGINQTTKHQLIL
jgi:hypothetical protein